MTAYTVKKPDAVTQKLDVETSPVGLQVTKKQSKDACVVECVPPSQSDPQLVSDELLTEFLNKDVIEKK